MNLKFEPQVPEHPEVRISCPGADIEYVGSLTYVMWEADQQPKYVFKPSDRYTWSAEDLHEIAIRLDNLNGVVDK